MNQIHHLQEQGSDLITKLTPAEQVQLQEQLQQLQILHTQVTEKVTIRQQQLDHVLQVTKDLQDNLDHLQAWIKDTDKQINNVLKVRLHSPDVDTQLQELQVD